MAVRCRSPASPGSRRTAAAAWMRRAGPPAASTRATSARRG